LLVHGRMPLRHGAPPRNCVAARCRGGCSFDAGRALQDISGCPFLWRESVGSFKKHLDVQWKELGFASARMGQRFAAAALVKTQVGGGTTRALPLHPPRTTARCVRRFVISLFHPHSHCPPARFPCLLSPKGKTSSRPDHRGQARVLNVLRRRRALAWKELCVFWAASANEGTL